MRVTVRAASRLPATRKRGRAIHSRLPLLRRFRLRPEREEAHPHRRRSANLDGSAPRPRGLPVRCQSHARRRSSRECHLVLKRQFHEFYEPRCLIHHFRCRRAKAALADRANLLAKRAMGVESKDALRMQLPAEPILPHVGRNILRER
jgi:hypothetical protein